MVANTGKSLIFMGLGALIFLGVALGAWLLTVQPVGAQASVPGAPTGLTARAIGVAGTDVVELTWTAPSAGRDSITHYTIQHSTDNGATWTGAGGVANTETENTARGVQTHHPVDAAAGANLYRVAAVNSVGTGPVSNRASVTPPADTAQPDAPANLTATANGSAEINLSWTRLTGADMGATSVTSYRIEHSTNGSLPWMELATVQAPSTGTTINYKNTGLAPETTESRPVTAVPGKPNHKALPGCRRSTPLAAVRFRPLPTR